MTTPKPPVDMIERVARIIVNIICILVFSAVAGFFYTVGDGLLRKDTRSTEQVRSLSLISEAPISDKCKLQIWHYNYGSERWEAHEVLYVTDCGDNAKVSK